MLSESQAVLASLSTRVITHVIPPASVDKEHESSVLNQQVFPLRDNTEQVSAIVCAIPFVRPRDVIKSRAGQSASDKQLNLQQAISDHYQNLYQHAQVLANNIEKEQGFSVPIIATGHLTALGVSVSDSKSDSVRDIYIGSLEAFPASAFPPADYIALGHIHRAQQVAKTEHIRYCGSPIALSFDEANQEKRVLLVEFTQGKLDQVTDVIVPCFQPLYMVKTSLDDLESSLQETLVLFQNYQDKQDNTGSTHSISDKAWLDIEIDNGDHLNDLSQRVSEVIVDMPFEILLVRRCKKARQRRQIQLSNEDNSTLSELSLIEVFDSRLSQLDWQTDEEVARKVRLQQLFSQLSVEVSMAQKKVSLSADTHLSSLKASNDSNKPIDTEPATIRDVQTETSIEKTATVEQDNL
jgi:exonuclease SbcD